jgi:hypothetical protein
MRALSATLFGMILLAPGALAQPLSAGKPAGVREAALGNAGTYLLVAAGVIVVVGTLGIALGNAQSSSGT